MKSTSASETLLITLQLKTLDKLGL